MKPSLSNEQPENGPCDEDLLCLVKRGERSALASLYDRYSGLVYSVALRVLRNPSSAEDVTQDLFLQLWRKPEGILVLNDTLASWMTIAARNRAISLVRKKPLNSLDNLILIAPLVREMQSENRLICRKALTLIRADQRLLLELAFFDELSHSEIAAATGEPLGTIKSRIRKAIQCLRAAVEEEQLPLLSTGLPPGSVA